MARSFVNEGVLIQFTRTVYVVIRFSSHCATKTAIHQVTTMLATSKNVLCPGHSHLLTTSADDPTLWGVRWIIKVKSHQHRWLAGGYDLEKGHF